MNMTALVFVLVILLIIILILAVIYGIKLSQLSFLAMNKKIDDTVKIHFIDISPSSQSLIDLAVEVWRIEKRFAKAKENLSDDQNKAFENSTNKLNRFLQKNDITYVDYTDQKYNEGLNLDVLDIEKDENAVESIIKDTHEPAVFHMGKLIKKAKVVVSEK